jgi:hypothetical protein
MRRPDIGDVPFCLGVNPSGWNAAAWKNHGVRSVPIDDGQLKIAVERSACYRLPFHREIVGPGNSRALI